MTEEKYQGLGISEEVFSSGTKDGERGFIGTFLIIKGGRGVRSGST